MRDKDNKMGLFGLFRCLKSRPRRTPSTFLRDALAAKGIATTVPEIDRVIAQVNGMLKVKPALPEELMHSTTAELQYTGQSYEVAVSMTLLDGAGHISPGALDTVMSLATYYAVASEKARAKGVQQYALKAGQRIGICDFTAPPRHRIHQLFPELLSKTAMV